jgi:hypothetical protein
MGDRDRGGWKEGAAMKRVTDIELEQALVYIRRMRVDNERKLEDARRIVAEHDKYRRETWWFPIVIVVSGMTAGAALLAAGATLTKLEARLKQNPSESRTSVNTLRRSNIYGAPR